MATLVPPSFESLILTKAKVVIRIVKYDKIGTTKDITARMNAMITQSGVFFFILKFNFKVLNNFRSLEKYKS
jgi:hypothetical protein